MCSPLGCRCGTNTNSSTSVPNIKKQWYEYERGASMLNNEDDDGNAHSPWDATSRIEKMSALLHTRCAPPETACCREAQASLARTWEWGVLSIQERVAAALGGLVFLSHSVERSGAIFISHKAWIRRPRIRLFTPNHFMCLRATRCFGSLTPT